MHNSGWRALLFRAALALGRMPKRTKLLLGILLVATLVLALRGGPVGNLRLQLHHQLRSAEINVWVDDDLIYRGKINGAKKRPGNGFEQMLRVPDGPHTIRVRVKSKEEGYDQMRTVRAEFGPDHEGTLQVSVSGKRYMELIWNEVKLSAAVRSWYITYPKAILLTISGALLSALVGSGVQAFMTALRSRVPGIGRV
jgi:hypothetical protein